MLFGSLPGVLPPPATRADLALLLGLMCYVSTEDCHLVFLNSQAGTVTTFPTAEFAALSMLDAHAKLVALAKAVVDGPASRAECAQYGLGGWLRALARMSTVGQSDSHSRSTSRTAVAGACPRLCPQVPDPVTAKRARHGAASAQTFGHPHRRHSGRGAPDGGRHRLLCAGLPYVGSRRPAVRDGGLVRGGPFDGGDSPGAPASKRHCPFRL